MSHVARALATEGGDANVAIPDGENAVSSDALLIGYSNDIDFAKNWGNASRSCSTIKINCQKLRMTFNKLEYYYHLMVFPIH